MSRKKEIALYLISILIALAVGGISAFINRSGMELFETTTVKPILTPPGFVFSIVWTILYALMGFSAARFYCKADSTRKSGLWIYFLQLFFNFLWTILFFSFQQYLFSFIWLLILILLVFLMIAAFHQVDKKAAFLQFPYLIWLLFAAYLNLGVVLLN